MRKLQRPKGMVEMDLIKDVRLNLRFEINFDKREIPNICLGQITRRSTNGPLDLDEYTYSNIFCLWFLLIY